MEKERAKGRKAKEVEGRHAEPLFTILLGSSVLQLSPRGAANNAELKIGRRMRTAGTAGSQNLHLCPQTANSVMFPKIVLHRT